MKLIAKKFIEIGDAIFNLELFQSLTVKKDAVSGQFVISFNFVGGTPKWYCDTEDARDEVIDEFVRILNDFGGIDNDPLAPPKGFIDLTTLTSNPAESYVMLINVSEIKTIQDRGTYTNIGTADGIYAYNETYDVVVERIKEALK